MAPVCFISQETETHDEPPRAESKKKSSKGKVAKPSKAPMTPVEEPEGVDS